MQAKYYALTFVFLCAGCKSGPEDKRPFAERAGHSAAEAAGEATTGVLKAADEYNWDEAAHKAGRTTRKAIGATKDFLKGIIEDPERSESEIHGNDGRRLHLYSEDPDP